jgi:hypothetical protein
MAELAHCGDVREGQVVSDGQVAVNRQCILDRHIVTDNKVLRNANAVLEVVESATATLGTDGYSYDGKKQERTEYCGNAFHTPPYMR